MLSADQTNTHARSRLPSFVFLDRNSRVPLEKESPSGGYRSIVTLSKEKELNSDFPLMLPCISKLKAEKRTLTRTVSDVSTSDEQPSGGKAEGDSVEDDLPPVLPFRVSAEKDGEHESPQAFFRSHFNHSNQAAFKRKVIGIRRKRVALWDEALNHFDPQERSAVPSYAGNPLSPMFMTLPDTESQEDKAVGKAMAAPSSPKKANTRPSLSEGKTASDGSMDMLRSNLERLKSNNRISHQAKAA